MILREILHLRIYMIIKLEREFAVLLFLIKQLNLKLFAKKELAYVIEFRFFYI